MSDSAFDTAWKEAAPILVETFKAEDPVVATMGSPCGAGTCGAGPCGSTLRTIDAVVSYPSDDRPVADMGRTPAPAIRVTVLNDSTVGLTVDEFTQTLSFMLPVRKGSAETRKFRFARITSQDAGLVTCEVR